MSNSYIFFATSLLCCGEISITHCVPPKALQRKGEREEGERRKKGKATEAKLRKERRKRHRANRIPGCRIPRVAGRQCVKLPSEALLSPLSMTDLAASKSEARQPLTELPCPRPVSKMRKYPNTKPPGSLLLWFSTSSSYHLHCPVPTPHPSLGILMPRMKPSIWAPSISL